MAHFGGLDVSLVGYEFDGGKFNIGSISNPATRKYKNVADSNKKVALVIDDLESVDPWENTRPDNFWHGRPGETVWVRRPQRFAAGYPGDILKPEC